MEFTYFPTAVFDPGNDEQFLATGRDAYIGAQFVQETGHPPTGRQETEAMIRAETQVIDPDFRADREKCVPSFLAADEDGYLMFSVFGKIIRFAEYDTFHSSGIVQAVEAI